jgi:hypothetical protein
MSLKSGEAQAPELSEFGGLATQKARKELAYEISFMYK